MCVLIFFATFAWNIYHSTRNSSRYYHKSSVKCPFLLSHFNKTCPAGTEFFHAERQTDGEADGRTDMAKLTSSSDGATARGGPWPPLQYASRSLGPLLCLSIRLYPSFSGPWTRHPAISFLVFLFVLLHTAFRTASFFGIAVFCILSICPSHFILWHLINLTMFCPLIMASNSSKLTSLFANLR